MIKHKLTSMHYNSIQIIVLCLTDELVYSPNLNSSAPFSLYRVVYVWDIVRLCMALTELLNVILIMIYL